MKVDHHLLFLMVAMAAVTYVPRVFPLLCLSRRNLPNWLETWLDFVPAAVLSALVVPAVVGGSEPRHLELLTPQLLAAIPTFLFAMRTRSLGGTIALGMALFWCAGKVLG